MEIKAALGFSCNLLVDNTKSQNTSTKEASMIDGRFHDRQSPLRQKDLENT